MTLATLFDTRRISGQLALLILCSVVLSHGLITCIFLMRGPPGDSDVRPVLDRFVTLVRVLGAAREPGARSALIEAAARAYPQLDLASGSADADTAPLEPALDLRTEALGGEITLRQVGRSRPSGTEVRVQATLSDGALIAATLPSGPGRPPRLTAFIVVTLVVTVTSLVFLLIWAARGLTAPLTRFAGVAEQFSLDGAALLLPETGPTEIRTASCAFNRMQARIRGMIDDRTRMLASVSHDLRTPITRLRLRAEFIPDAGARIAILRDLDQMNAMIHGALAFLRDGPIARSGGKLDIAALLRTVADDFADLGHDVRFEGPDRQIVEGRADDLQRAIANLVENATKHATATTVRLAVFPGAVEIEVADDGPGIPPELRDAMMQPFARGDAARGVSEAAGFGLGLSIARAIVEDHGGRLVLLDREPQGLVVRVTLPLSPATPEARAEAVAATQPAGSPARLA